MNAKEYLSQYRAHDNRINVKLDEIAELRVRAEKITVSMSGNVGGCQTSDNVGKLVAKIVDMERQVNSDIDDLKKLKLEIENTIERVPDERQRAVLRYRYIGGLTWEQIAEKTHYTYQHVCRLHGYGLQTCDRML